MLPSCSTLVRYLHTDIANLALSHLYLQYSFVTVWERQSWICKRVKFVLQTYLETVMTKIRNKKILLDQLNITGEKLIQSLGPDFNLKRVGILQLITTEMRSISLKHSSWSVPHFAEVTQHSNGLGSYKYDICSEIAHRGRRTSCIHAAKVWREQKVKMEAQKQNGTRTRKMECWRSKVRHTSRLGMKWWRTQDAYSHDTWLKLSN